MAQAGLLIPAADGIAGPGVPQRVRRHRRRAVDRREPQHVLGAHRQRRRDGQGARAAGAGAARRGRRRHRPERGGRARDGDHRPLPHARRDGGRDDALRRAEDVCVHDRGGDVGRLRLQSAKRSRRPTGCTTARRAAAWRSRSPRGWACRPASSRRRARSGPPAKRSSRSTSRKVEREMQGLDHERRLVARERQMVEETQTRLQAREHELRDREETFRRRLDQKIEERLRDAKREIDTVVEALKARAARRRRTRARLVPTGDIGAARADARAALERSRAAARRNGRSASAACGGYGETSDPSKGIGSRLARWASRGSSSRSTTGTRKWTCAASGCARSSTTCAWSRRRRTAAPPVARARERRPGAARRRQPDRDQRHRQQRGRSRRPRRTVPRRSVDERARSLRIIHGYGTGPLRRSIAEFLRAHPLVANFGPAPDNQGGGGARRGAER